MTTHALKLAFSIAAISACAVAGAVVAVDARPAAAPLRPALAQPAPTAVDAPPLTLPLVNSYVS